MLHKVNKRFFAKVRENVKVGLTHHPNGISAHTCARSLLSEVNSDKSNMTHTATPTPSSGNHSDFMHSAGIVYFGCAHLEKKEWFAFSAVASPGAFEKACFFCCHWASVFEAHWMQMFTDGGHHFLLYLWINYEIMDLWIDMFIKKTRNTYLSIWRGKFN